MSFSRKTPIPYLITFLILTMLACQAVTQIPADGTSDNNGTIETINSDEIVAQAVATISAQTTAVNAESVVLEAPSAPINANLQDRFIEIYDAINPSVVHIFIFDDQNLGLGSGSGFVIDNDGHIVTNNHVIANGTVIEVVFANGERRPAAVTGTDIDSDLAVIQVESLPAGVMPVQLGDSNTVQVGEFVVAIGNPFGESGSMTVGVVSGLGRSLDSQRITALGRFSIPQVIQTDAAINPGNSGGPLINLKGEVIGVNSAIQSLTGENSGVGFSIPVNAVTNIVPSLIEEGRFIYSYIGISMTSEPLTLAQLQEFDLPPNGVYITGVQSDTPGEQAGLIGSNTDSGFNVPLQAGGDYIREVNGVSIRTSNDLLSYLVFETKPGDTIDLTILRNGSEIIVPLTLGERP